MTKKENFTEIEFLELLIESVREEYTDYVSDLYSAYYEHEMTCYYGEAESILAEYGVFDGISEVIEYEKANYGEVHVDVSNPCMVANRLFTIKACDYLYELQGNNKEIGKLIDDNWQNKFTPELRKELLELLENELSEYVEYAA